MPLNRINVMIIKSLLLAVCLACTGCVKYIKTDITIVGFIQKDSCYDYGGVATILQAKHGRRDIICGKWGELNETFTGLWAEYNTFFTSGAEITVNTKGFAHR